MSGSAQIVKNIIEELLDKLSVDAVIEVENTLNDCQFMVRTSEGGLLIGENGKNLAAFHHLVKKISEKKFKEEENFSFSLDVNDYRLKIIDELKNFARLNAQRVRYFKKEIVLRPMTSFERRIVHEVLSDCPDITTESRGNEPCRQVVIKPYL